MASTQTGTDKPKRVVKRLTADERKAKNIAGIDSELAKAQVALVNAAQGMVASGDRARARKCLDLWQDVADVQANDSAEQNGTSD